MKPERTEQKPELIVALEVDSALEPVAVAGHPLNETVHTAVVQTVNGLMESLGIPGIAKLTITAMQFPERRVQFVSLSVDSHHLHYSDELLISVYSCLNNTPLRSDVRPAEVLSWLAKLCAGESSDDGRQMVTNFLSQMAAAIITQWPASLLGQSQLDAYVASLGEPAADPVRRRDLASVRLILTKVLQLKISIADKTSLGEALVEGAQMPWSDCCEDLVDALHPRVIEIHVQERYLRELTTVDAEHRVGLFAFLRDGLFTELGVVYPEFRLVADPNLRDRQFAFKLNHLTGTAQVGLGPGDCLVNDTPERLALLNIPAKPTANPATGQPNSITNLEHKSVLEKNGLTTWDEMGYLILSLAATLRNSAECYIRRDSTETQLTRVDYVFPALVKSARSVFSVQQITSVLRELVAEGIPIRNLRLILERLLDYQFHNDLASDVVINNDETAIAALCPGTSDELTDLVAFVRAGMKRQISSKYSKGTSTVVVYLLEHAIERLLATRQREKEQDNKILNAIREETRHLPPTAQMPVLLTRYDVRRKLRNLVAPEFPRLSVVAYEELLPALNVQPVARISRS